MPYIAPNNPDFKSSALLNAIKGSATPLFQRLVPDATATNLSEVGDSIMNDPRAFNEFVVAILDRIGKVVIKNMAFENPLKPFKKGLVNKGRYIEEVFIDIIKAKAYNPRNSSAEVEKRALPDVKAVFHELNRTDVFKTTIEEETISLAFTSEEGFGLMLDKIIDTLMVSNEVAEFELMKSLIRVAGMSGKLAVEVITAPTDESSAKQAVRKIKKLSNDFLFPSDKFNHAGVVNTCPKSKQVVMMSTDFDSIVDVEVLASAFNMDKVEFMGKRVIVDNFGGLTNVVAMLVSEDWLMVYDKLFKTKARENQDGLYWNYFLHVWQFMSSSPFENAVLLVTANPTLTAIDVKPATATAVKGGDPIHFTIEATGTNNPPVKCTWTHDGASPDTFVNPLGMLYVAHDETEEEITVTATSVFNPLITDTAVVTVV